MKDLTVLNNELTMSSREIAELTGKEHRHIMRDIRNLENQLKGMFEGSAQSWTHPQNNQVYEYYNLSKDTTLTLLLGYDAVARMKVVKRWQELESQYQPQFQIPTTLAGALRLAAEQAETIEAQTKQLELAKPAQDFVHQYVESSGLIGFREACKIIGAKENAFRAFLVEQKIMYRLNKGWAAYASHIDAGRFETKTGTAENGHSFSRVLFTPKGINWIAGEWAKHQIKL